MKELRELFINKYLIYFCILIVIQQIIFASATIWIANLGKAIINGEPIWLYLSLTLLSSLIVFIPPILAMMLVQKAKFTTKNKYLLRFIENHKGVATLARDQELRNEKEAWPVAESDLIIQDFLYFCYSSLTVVLMIFFTVVAIIYVTEPIIIIGYICALLIASAFLISSKNKVTEVSNQYQDSSIATRKCLMQSWDNILIGNEYNLNNWTNKYFTTVNRLTKRAVIMMGTIEFFSSFPVVIACAPVVIVIIWLFNKHSSDASYLAALVATLPKQIQTIQYVHSFSNLITNWHSIKPRLLKLLDSMHLTQRNFKQLQQRITWKLLDISCGNKKINIKSFDEFIEYLKKEPTGRITIRGPNGSGKSTMLALIKEKYRVSAVYLPANHDLSFSSTGIESLSSGEKRIKELNELIKESHVKLLLLDEWDANLDPKNVIDVSSVLDNLAQTISLIEVRHR